METNFEIQKKIHRKFNWEIIQDVTRARFEDVQREQKIFYKFENNKEGYVKPAGESKRDNMEVVCARLKNDLKWHRNTEEECNPKRPRIAIRKGATTVGFSREIADNLMEEWWLNS